MQRGFLSIAGVAEIATFCKTKKNCFSALFKTGRKTEIIGYHNKVEREAWWDVFLESQTIDPRRKERSVWNNFSWKISQWQQ